nr:hypothetical protein C4D60_Mb11t19700 [Ipomoea batatas]
MLTCCSPKPLRLKCKSLIPFSNFATSLVRVRRSPIRVFSALPFETSQLHNSRLLCFTVQDFATSASQFKTSPCCGAAFSTRLRRLSPLKSESMDADSGLVSCELHTLIPFRVESLISAANFPHGRRLTPRYGFSFFDSSEVTSSSLTIIVSEEFVSEVSCAASARTPKRSISSESFTLNGREASKLR